MPQSGERRWPDGRLQARWRGLGCPDGMSLYEVRCRITEKRWVPALTNHTFTVNLARSGGYLRRVNGTERFVDATSALLVRPTDDLTIAHPLRCGDVYTALEINAEVLAERADAESWLHRDGWDGVISDDLDLEHRTLIADCRRGIDPFETTERVHRLLTGLLANARGDARASAGDDLVRAVNQRPATLVAHRKLADRAREAIADEGFALGLTEVARIVGCSPHHLSRVFHRTTGQSLTAHRNRVRVRSVLTALADDDRACLRTLAAEHGFADQAHLTRTVRQHLGQPPAQLRRILANPEPMC